MDEGMLDGKAAMTRFLNLIASEPDVAKASVRVCCVVCVCGCGTFTLSATPVQKKKCFEKLHLNRLITFYNASL